MNPRKIGLINGILVLIFWSACGMLLATHWQGAFPVIVFILLPVSVLVAWRSFKMAILLQAGKVALKHYALDGFKYGFIVSCALWVCSISMQVWAAGNVLDNASFIQIVKFILLVSIPTSILAGIIGLLHAIGFYYLNRWQISS